MSTAAQGDAPLVRPSSTDRASITNRRVIAAIIDVWLLTSMLTASAHFIVSTSWSVFLGMTVATVLLAVGEAAVGQSPGKRLAQLRVETLEGQRPRLTKALLRRAWMPLQAVVAVFDPTTLLALGIVLALAWSVYRDPQGRGWHDQVGGTQVVAFAGGPRWLKLLGVGVVIAGIATVVWQVAAAPAS